MVCVWMMRDHAVKQMLHPFSYSPTPLMATLKYHMEYGTSHAPDLFPKIPFLIPTKCILGFPKNIFQDAKASLVTEPLPVIYHFR